MDLNERLKSEAREKGLCDMWFENWGNPDKQGLIEKALHGMNFLCEHDFPSLDFIKMNFDAGQLRDNNFFIDEEVHRRNMGRVVALNGRCSVMLLYDGYSVADIYIRHDCDVVIDVNGCAKVFVTVYDRANVKVRQGGMGRVYVYKNDDSCIVETEGSVTMRERKSGA